VPQLFRVSEIDEEADIAEWAGKFPGSHYADVRFLHPTLREEFEVALQAGREEAIQKLLTANPYLLQYVTPNTGHHGIWVFPKRQIRTQRVDGTPGLIPDYLVAAKNSLGYTWHIVELKLATVQFAKPSGESYTRDAADGIAQCAKYRAHFADYIETVRSNIGIPDAITPESVILLIGDGLTETDKQRTCRSEFDRLGPSMSVVSYDRIRRGLANDLRFTGSST
jgi:hypothetical protein